MLCQHLHQCDAHDLSYAPDSSAATCRLCGREWEQYVDEHGHTRVRLVTETPLPRWILSDTDHGKLANIDTGEIINVADAQACDTVHERNTPCDACPANVSSSALAAGD